MAQPLTWAIQTVGGRQVENDGSRLVNFYAINPQVPQEARAPVILYGVPGYEDWMTPAAAGGRTGIQGMIAIDSPLRGRRLCGISSGSQFFQIREGQAPTTHAFTTDPNEYYDSPARFAEDGRRVLFIRGRSIVQWDMAANSGAGDFQPVMAPVAGGGTDILPDENWVDIIWLQGYFVLLSRGGQIFHSELNSDTFNQLDFATAERNPDPGVALMAWAGRFYVFGTRTIEAFMNDGGSPFAFRTDRSYAIPHGCIARDTVQSDEGAMYFLGHDKIFYGFTGGKPVRLSNGTIEYDIARSTAENAVGYVYTEEGRRFYSLILDIPGEGKKNWTIDFTTGFWHERTVTNMLCAARHLERNFVGLSDRAAIQEQDLDFGTVPGDGEFEREAISRLISANEQNLVFHSLWIDLPQFDAPPAGSDEILELDWSDDGQETWKGYVDNGVTRPRGYGQTDNLRRRRLRFNLLGSTQEGRNFRIKVRSKGRVQINATYHDSDIQGGGYVRL